MRDYVVEEIRRFADEVKSKNIRGLLIFDNIDLEEFLSIIPEERSILLITKLDKDSKFRGYRENLELLRFRDYKKILGKEYDYAIINLTNYNHLTPNLLCVVAETIRMGGLLVIKFRDIENQNVGIFGTRYSNYIKKLFRECKCNMIIHNGEILSRRIDVDKIYENYLLEELTEDQKQTLNIFHRFINDVDKTAFIVKGGRGRGKTYILGYLAWILHKDYSIPRVDVIAEELPKSFIEGIKAACKNHVKHYRNIIKVDKFTIKILKPGEKTTCPIVIADEASRIGIARIRRLLSRCYKLIMSLTTYGYEGSGRYFEHYIVDIVNRRNIGITVELRQPVRYLPNDPLEEWLNRIFVLESGHYCEDKYELDISLVKFRLVNKDELLSNVEYFRRIISILRDAHYKYSPDDIEILLDSDVHFLVVGDIDDKPIAVAHVRIEEAKIEHVKRAIEGERLPGLNTFTILARYGTSSIHTLKIWRIHRIAVHVNYQRRGIGSRLLRYLEELARNHRIDMITSIFSRREVLDFWLKNGYTVFYISPRFNKVTGDYNYGVCKIISERCSKIMLNILQDFKRRLILLSSSVYRDIDSELLCRIVMSIRVSTPIKLSISSLQDRRCRIFNNFADKYDVEYVQDIAYIKLVNYLMNSVDYREFTSYELSALICKILQGKSIKDVASTLNTSIDEAKRILKKCIMKLLRR